MRDAFALLEVEPPSPPSPTLGVGRDAFDLLYSSPGAIDDTPEQSSDDLRRSVLAGSGTSAISYPGEFLASIPRGAARTAVAGASGAVQLAGEALDLAGIDNDVAEWARETARPVQQAIESALPVTPGFEDSWTRAIGEGIGSTAPAFVTGGVGGIPGIIGFGASTGYASSFENAKELGATDDEAKQYARLSALVTGATEPIGAAMRTLKILKRADKATGGWLGKEILKASGGEALQEAIQEVPDEVARRAYIKDRKLWDSLSAVGEAGVVGGTVGVIFSGAGAAVKAWSDRAKEKLVEDYRSRVAAGQKDPVPNQEAFKAAGYEGDPPRRERKVEIERLLLGEPEPVSSETQDVAPKPSLPTAQETVDAIIQGQVEQGGQQQYPQAEVGGLPAEAGGRGGLIESGQVEAKAQAEGQQAAQGEVSPVLDAQQALSRYRRERKYTNKTPQAVLQADVEYQRLLAAVQAQQQTMFTGGTSAYSPSRPTSEGPPPADQGPTEAQFGGPFQARPIQMPELVKLAQDLMGIRPQISRRLRRSLGLFKGREGSALTQILLNPKTAVNEDEMARVLAHEIGHLTDFLPQKTLRRGNILGRIASLRSYLKEHLEAYEGAPGTLTAEDEARIAAEIQRLTSTTVEKEIDEEIERVTGLTPKDILDIWNATAETKVNKQVEDYIKKLTNGERKSIIAAAIKGQVPDALKQFANVTREKTGRRIKVTETVTKSYASLQKEIKEAVEAEIRKRQLFSAKQVREELLALTRWWSGDWVSGSGSYAKYRESSRELYAEALSVFLTAPKELKARAPEFWRGLMAYANRKPEFVEAHLSLKGTLSGDPEQLARERTQRVRSMFGQAEQQMQFVDQEREAGKRSAGWAIKNFLNQALVDRWHPVGRTGTKQQQRQAAAQVEQVREILDEVNDIDSPLRSALERTDREVIGPLMDRGVNMDDVGEFLLYRRVMADRAEVGNPLGFTPKTSEAQLTALRNRLGPERFGFLEQAMQHWHRTIVWPFVERAVAAGVYGRKAFAETLLPNRDNYATFVVVKHYEGRVSSGILKQLGTFEDIANPFVGSLMKLITLNRMIELNRAKSAVTNLLTSAFPQDIKEAPIPYGKREPKGLPRPGYDHLVLLRDGKPVGYEVPSEIADGFMRSNVGVLAGFARYIGSPTYRIFHPLYVTYSLSFGTANPIRDLRRTAINLGATTQRRFAFMRDILPAWFRSFPQAWRRARGIDDTLLNQMQNERALMIPWSKLKIDPEQETKLERLLAEYGVRDAREVRGRAMKLIKWLLGAIEGTGVFFETASKVAGYRVLAEKTALGARERAYVVRNYVGTPNIRQVGLASPLTNSLFMYQKVKYNGLVADTRLATNPKTAAGWWWRRMWWTLIPATLEFAALYGIFGDYLKELFGKLSDEHHQNSDNVPFGMTDSGKSVTLAIPEDDTGRLLRAVTWNALQLIFPQDDRSSTARLAGIAKDLGAQVFLDPSPPIQIAEAWASYAVGHNPYDRFFGRDLLSDSEFKAGGWPAARKMLWWTANKFGVLSVLAHPFISQLRGPKVTDEEESTLEIALGTFPGLQRLLKVSDRGEDERLQVAIENEDRESARFRLSLDNDTRRLTARQFVLNRNGVEGLTEEQNAERLALNYWYGKIYIPLTTGIKAAEQQGEDASELRAALAEASRQFRAEAQ